MSIINDALKKTQQVRKADKEKFESAKQKKLTGANPVSSQVTALRNTSIRKSVLLSPDFWLTSKMAIGLILIATSLMLYSRFIHNSKVTLGSYPKTMEVGSKKPVVFTGVLLADNQPKTALINQKPMHVGDTLNGMKIVAIRRDAVDLQSVKGLVEIKAGATYQL